MRNVSLRRWLLSFCFIVVLSALFMVGALADDTIVQTSFGYYVKEQFYTTSLPYKYAKYYYNQNNQHDNYVNNDLIVFCVSDDPSRCYFLTSVNSGTLYDYYYRNGVLVQNNYLGPTSYSVDGTTWYMGSLSNSHNTYYVPSISMDSSIQDHSDQWFSVVFSSIGLSSTPPAQPTLFVAAPYNNNPLSIKQGFTNISLSASYNLYDSEYTSVYNNNNFVSSRPVFISPQNYYSQYVCFESFNYSSSQYKSISVSGTFDFYFQTSSVLDNNLNQNNFIYPSSSYLAVNGEPVFVNVSSNGNGSFSYSGTIDISEDIVSIGVISTFDNSTSVLGVSDFSAGFYGSNNLSITPNLIVVPTPDPNTTLGDLQVDTSTIEGKIDTEIGKQNTIIGIIQDIPQNVGNAFYKAFVPDAQVFDDYSVLYGSLLEDKLGFVWQSGSLILDAVSDFQGYLAGEISPQPLTFPGVSFPMNGSTITILQPTQVDLNNDLMAVLKPWLDRMIVFVCTIAFLNTCRDMVISIASGASYMEYLHRKARAEDASD